MATHTTNYNLEKPEASDPFGDFRQSYNDNMDIIDANLGGGGGGGGHTIIDPNGNSLPQESGLQFTGSVNVTDDNVNGRTVVDISGGGNVYGAFLDPSRVIYSAFTFDSSTHSWTATEDCILTDNMTPPDGSTAYFIRIDGKQVFAGYNTVEDPFVYVKKGQVVEYRAKSGSTMKAYGILQGTNGIFAPVIYSDTERKIGIWRDNKPLYAKTLNPTVNIGGNTINHGIANLENCVRIYGVCKYNNTGEQLPLPYVSTNTAYSIACGNVTPTNYLVDVGAGFSSIQECYVTLYYTKTTDVAGSGDWNTDGVPTVHYSTSEQVIGTWENGKPIYEKVVKNLSIALDGTNWVYYNTPNDIDEVINLECYSDNGGKLLHCAISEYRVSPTNGVQFSGFSGLDRTVNEMIIRYTKITD